MGQPTPDSALDLDDLLQSMVQSLHAAFPMVQAVEAHTAPRRRMPVPSLLIEAEDFEAAPDHDPGTEQLALNARFRARLVYSFADADVAREIRRMALAIAAFVHGQRWGFPMEPARVLLVTPDDFEPALDEYEVFGIEWEQVCHFGTSVFVETATPRPIYSWAPEIGPGFEDHYRPLSDVVRRPDGADQ